MGYCIFFPVPAIIETAMEALPLLAVYLFNAGKLKKLFHALLFDNNIKEIYNEAS